LFNLLFTYSDVRNSYDSCVTTDCNAILRLVTRVCKIFDFTRFYRCNHLNTRRGTGHPSRRSTHGAVHGPRVSHHTPNGVRVRAQSGGLQGARPALAAQSSTGACTFVRGHWNQLLYEYADFLSIAYPHQVQEPDVHLCLCAYTFHANKSTFSLCILLVAWLLNSSSTSFFILFDL